VLYPAEYAASFSTLPALLQTTLLHQNEPVLLLESQPAGNNGGGPMVGVKRRAVEAGGSVVDQAPKKRLRVDPEVSELPKSKKLLIDYHQLWVFDHFRLINHM
jgi:hypothetical protein